MNPAGVPRSLPLLAAFCVLAASAVAQDTAIRQVQVVISRSGGAGHMASILYKAGFTLGGIMEDSRSVEDAGPKTLEGRTYHTWTEGGAGYTFYTLARPGEGSPLVAYFSMNMPVSRIFLAGTEVTPRDYVLRNGKKELNDSYLGNGGGEVGLPLHKEPVVVLSYSIRKLEELSRKDQLVGLDSRGSESAFEATIELDRARPAYIAKVLNPRLRPAFLEAKKKYLYRAEVENYGGSRVGQAFYGLVVGGTKLDFRMQRYRFGGYDVYGVMGDPNTGAEVLAVALASLSQEEYATFTPLLTRVGQGIGRAWDGAVQWGSGLLGN